VQRASGIPCALSLKGESYLQTSGAMRREIARPYLDDGPYVADCNRLARRNISLLAKALPTGQKNVGNKKRQRRTI